MTAPSGGELRASIAELLDAAPSEITDGADLLDLGLDSIRLMTLVQRWRDQGIEIDFESLAECPTVENWERVLAARAKPEPVLLTVRRVEELTPRTVRVTFGGGRVDAFAAAEPGGSVTLLLPAEDGIGGDEQPRRYAARYCAEPAELDVEMVVHDAGPGGRWAGRARPGTQVRVGGPHPAAAVPAAAQLLVAVDETGLPALAHRLEALAAGTRVDAVVEVPDAAEERDLATPADLRVHWLHRNNGAAIPPAALPTADVAWVAGAATFTAKWQAALPAARCVTETYRTDGANGPDGPGEGQESHFQAL
ncbi:SIP domain-containing protein [Pseudonocardia sp. TRM90224]|uniref:SIP domain-containing protein n=1 Tax=Pseudonocardia sp. TRM90224 TaxID=2812678 RepID=UPI001E40F77A|nr:SIP domain-containing protein [Pseudonocardia sp. TRM90224]